MATDSPTATPGPKPRVRVLTYRSEGQFAATAWIKEGDHLLVSAKAMRATWVVKRRKLTRALTPASNWTPRGKTWAELEGLPKASVLLLGYALEMYLKAGLTKLYAGCPEPLFDRDVRLNYGHDFKKLAKAVAFNASAQDKSDLKTLRDMVLFGARYPIKPVEHATVIRLQAERMVVMWSKSEFTRLRHLVLRVRTHVSAIDMDSRDPMSVASIKVDDDGYVVYRTGGGLPARVTYRYSSTQRASGEDNLDSLRTMADAGELLLLALIWHQAEFYEDDLG